MPKHPVSRVVRRLRSRLRADPLPDTRHIELTIDAEFDSKFYVEAYPEAVPAGTTPIRHFIETGWRAGLDPNPLFSTRKYLEHNPDVAASGVNPLLHFVEYGRKEGRFRGFSDARKPKAPLDVPQIDLDPAYWAKLTPPAGSDPTRAPIDIVIPVYKGLEHTAACLHSVFRAQSTRGADVIVVNDNTPDPAIGAFLTMLRDAGLITLITNETNLGFIGSINLGARQHPDRDVFFLNSDAMVFGDYIDRLAALAAAHPRVATITPLTNNGTICSYPEPDKDNAFELESPPDRLDRLAAEVNDGTVINLPTGVSYGMFVTRPALDDVGPFDAETFGMGYGEENDFSRRAARRGWRNVLAPGIYLRHFGSVSFGAEMTERAARAQEIVHTLHPGYEARIERYNAADPALPARILMDAARLRDVIGPVSILFVNHSWGGGVDTYFKHIKAAMRANGQEDLLNRALVARTHRNGYLAFEPLGNRKMPFTPNLLALDMDRHRSWLGQIFKILAPELIHVNSFAGLSQTTIRGLIDAITAAGRPYWHVWHDHQPLCPRLQFIDAQEQYCGETDITRCPTCLSSSIVAQDWVDITDWRKMFADYLQGAEKITAPSPSAANRARRICPPEKVEVHTHPEPFLADIAPLRRAPGRSNGAPIRVATLGALGPHKGIHLLAALAEDAANRDLPLTFDIIGFTSMPELADHPNVTVHGRYAGDAMAIEKLRAVQPDLFFMSSIWPETYMFTLSVGFALDLPVLSFDLGAQGERTRQYGRGDLLPPALIEDPAAVNDRILGLDLDALWSKPIRDRGFHVNAPFPDPLVSG